MATPAKKKDGVDLAVIFGGKGGGKPPPKPMGKEPDGDEMPGMGAKSDNDGDEPSEEFKTAMGETGLDLDDDQLGSLWRAIKACAGSY